LGNLSIKDRKMTKVKLGRCYITRNNEFVIITGYQPSKKFNKYIGYVVRAISDDLTTYTRTSPLMSWGEEGGYYWSGITSKHDITGIAPSAEQPLLSIDMMKII
jgi:hypothetical protein